MAAVGRFADDSLCAKFDQRKLFPRFRPNGAVIFNWHRSKNTYLLVGALTLRRLPGCRPIAVKASDEQEKWNRTDSKFSEQI